jgi:hypothetical protein
MLTRQLQLQKFELIETCAGDYPGIVVGNAQPSLVSWAVTQKQHGRAQTILTDKPLAHGILEGLARHGLY